MGLYILLALLGVPLLEIWVFIEVGGRLGSLTTIAIVVITAIVGAALLRFQGLATLARARASVEAGRMPVDEVFDGLCLLVAGIVLLTPGFVTDTIGLLLFVPAVRRGIGSWLRRRVLTAGPFRAGQTEAGPGASEFGGPVIDAEYVHVKTEPETPGPEDDDPPPPIDSRWGRPQ